MQALLHSLSRLSGHIDATHCVKFGFCDMQVTVEAAAFTPLRDDGKVGLGHVAHEQQDIDVASFPANNRRSKVKKRTFCSVHQELQQCLPQDLHFVFESLQLLRRRLSHFEYLDCYISVPLALEDCSKRTRTNPLLNGHFSRVDLPVVTGVSVTPPVLKHSTIGIRQHCLFRKSPTSLL